jgi:hypothetical protein
MKRTLLYVLLLSLLCIASADAAVTVSLNTSQTPILKVNLAGNGDIASFHFSVSGLPIAAVSCSDVNKVVDFYGSKVIIYGLNNTAIVNGDVISITFTPPQPYGTYPIVITPLSGATGSAVSATIQKGTDGSVSLTFSDTAIALEKDCIIGRSTVGGLDLVAPAGVDCADLQTMIKNRG